MLGSTYPDAHAPPYSAPPTPHPIQGVAGREMIFSLEAAATHPGKGAATGGRALLWLAVALR
jgi:hypothetical protein